MLFELLNYNIMKKNTYLLVAFLIATSVQAQTWTKLALPETGKLVSDLYEDAGGNLFALTNQGIFKSTDKAITWALVDRNMKGVQVMTVAPNGNIWVDETSATLKYDGTKTTQNKWYRWATNNTTANMVSLSDGKLIYTYADQIKRKQKYLTSTDNGTTFTESTTVTNVLLKGILQSQLMVKKNDDVFYLGSDKNLYKSTDKGVSYSAMGSVINHTGKEEGVCLDKEKGVFYAIWGSSNARDLYKSIDDGATWTKLNSSKLYGADKVVANNNVVIIYGSWFLSYSVDGGATFVNKSTLFETGQFPQKILIASDGKIYGTNIKDEAIVELDMTNDTRSLRTKGLDYTNAIGLSYNGTRLAGCLNEYAHYTDDNGVTWKKLKGEGAYSGNTYVAKNGKVYSASRKSGTWNNVYVQDGNDSMVKLNADVKEVWNMESMFEDDKGNIYCLSNLNGLYKSTDGVSFTQLANAPFDNLNKMTMWFSAGNKRIYCILHSPEEIHYSDDYGVSWTKGRPRSATVKIHFKGEGVIWVYSWSAKPAEDGYYNSVDLVNWNGPYKSTTSMDDRWDQPIQGNKGALYAAHSDNSATGSTVLVSSDKGETWAPYADGLDTVLGVAINGQQTKGVPYNQIIASNDKLFLGTNGSIYMANQGIGPTGIKDVNRKITTVYPNPTKDVLKIDSKVKVEEVIIYNHMGQVRLEVKNASNTLDVSSLKNGCYIMQIKNGREVSTAKFIINK